MATDFSPGPEWEQVKVGIHQTVPDDTVAYVDNEGGRHYWRRKPQEPTYTPASDEAKALYRKVFGHVAPKFSAATRYIDQALDAARQQGRDEYRAHNARGEDGPCECETCRRTLWAIKNSQGAGLGSQPDQRASQPSASSEGGSGGDGSTVASPLRGTLRLLRKKMNRLGDGRYANDPSDPTYLAIHFATAEVESMGDPEVITVTVEPGDLLNQLFTLSHQVPEGKVLVDRNKLRLAEMALTEAGYHLHAGDLRAALEGEN